jgi:ribokinase
VRFYGALGDGGHGRQMFKNLAKNKVDVSGVEFLDMPSGLATIFVDKEDGTHRVVVSHGANKKARQESIPDKFLNSKTTILIQCELPMAETTALVKRAKKMGARIIMNLAPVVDLSEDMLNDLDILIMNEHEADQLGNQIGADTKDKVSFAKLLFEQYNLIGIITLGPDGAVTITEEGLITVPSLKVTAIDTIGAGDAFCGFLAAGLDQGLSIKDAMRNASIAGAVTCTKLGAQSALPYADEIKPYLNDIMVSVSTIKTQAA